jgi:putative glutamine amidotransferase
MGRPTAKRRPVILVSPSFAPAGIEFDDPSISLSHRYSDTLIEAGGLPWILPFTLDAELIRQAVAEADGVLLTGGDDLHPAIHRPDASKELAARCIGVDPDRDIQETILLNEVFKNPKPLLAVCRGHQLVNVGLGGTLFIDLPTENPSDTPHNRCDLKDKTVHPVAIDPGSILAKITRRRSIRVNSTHHQAIDQLAPELRPVAVAPDGIIEATELGEDFVHLLPWFLSIQFHSERLAARHPEHRRIYQAFVHACGSTP